MVSRGIGGLGKDATFATPIYYLLDRNGEELEIAQLAVKLDGY